MWVFVGEQLMGHPSGRHVLCFGAVVILYFLQALLTVSGQHSLATRILPCQLLRVSIAFFS
jgi:hypothetical protein